MRGTRIAQEILDFGCRRVGGVERQEDPARTHRRQVEHQGLDRLLDLHGDAVASFEPRIDQGGREARRDGVDVGVAVGAAIGEFGEPAARIGPPGCHQAVEQRVGHATSFIASTLARPGKRPVTARLAATSAWAA